MKMVELDDGLESYFAEDFNQIELALQIEHYELLTLDNPTLADIKRRKELETLMRRFNTATQLNVQTSDLDAFGLDPQNAPADNTKEPEGVLVWDDGRNLVLSKEGYLNKIKELEEKIKRKKLGSAESRPTKKIKKSTLEGQLIQLKKAP